MNPVVKLCIGIYMTALLSMPAVASGTQCRGENGESYNNTFAGWTAYYLPGWVTNTGDGIWDSTSVFNSSRPVGSCSGYTSSTSKALGPLQVRGARNQLFEVTFYDEFYGVSLPDGRGGCYASGGGGAGADGHSAHRHHYLAVVESSALHQWNKAKPYHCLFYPP